MSWENQALARESDQLKNYETESMKTRPTRVAFLNSHPIQYFAPLYAYLNSDPEFEVTALYMSDFSVRGGRDRGFGQPVTWDIDLLAGYRSVFLGDAARRRTPGGFWSLVVPEVWSAVRNGDYDALVVHGHNYAANLIAIAAAKSIGLPVLIRGEMHLGLVRTRLRRVLRKPLMSLFYRLTDRALAIGTANAEYYRAMGMQDRQIFLMPYCVDNDRFALEGQLSSGERAEWRGRFGIPADVPAILYAGKFTARKRPDDLLRAAARLRQISNVPFSVVMCGSGEDEASLRSLCEMTGLSNVIFTGFVNQATLPKLYGACDIFVLPAYNEPWGLAVNEAMCGGMALVVSREVGCVSDLVSNGVNGFTPEAGDIEGLTKALQLLVEDAPSREKFRSASIQRVSGWGYREAREGLRQALRSLQTRGRNPLIDDATSRRSVQGHNQTVTS